MTAGLMLETSQWVRPDALWEALRHYEKLADLGPDVQDSFIVGALQTMAYEPFTVDALHPENWLTLNGGLDINVRLTTNGKLALDVSPWTERLHPLFRHWRMEEFATFPGDGNMQRRPVCTIHEFALDELAPELRDSDMAISADDACKRKLVFCCYQFVLTRLTQHFKCRVQTALVCIGDEARLVIRKTALLSNPAERANLLAGDSSFRWHPQYSAQCERHGVLPDELLAFFRKTLAPLPRNERLDVLRQFLGKPNPNAYGNPKDGVRALLGPLTVIAQPDKFPPLVNHPDPRLEKTLAAMIKASGPWNGPQAIAHHYHLDEANIHRLLRQHYPDLLVRTFRDVEKIRREVEYFVKERADVPNISAALQRWMQLRLYETWVELSSMVGKTRRRQLATAAAFGNFEDLTAWSEGFCPNALPWLLELGKLKRMD